MENRTIYLVRHGKVQLEDDQRRFIGQLDVTLNTDGISQAKGLQKRLERADISTVYCSDLARSLQTAEITVAHKAISIIQRKDLREIYLGEWEGCTFADIARRFPKEFKERGTDIGYYRVPGGENFADCSRRVVAALHEVIQSTSGNILIVGHAGVNRLLLCYALGMPLGNLFRIGQDYGCLNILQINNAGFQVKLVNFPAAKR